MNKIKYIALSLLAGSAMFMTGCVRPVEPKTLVTANANETMFVIPLQGSNESNQAKFNSIDYFNNKKVAVKQILLSYYWLQTGRFSWVGHWVPSETVIKVNRSPVTAFFAVENKSDEKRDADAIWIESADSVGFSTGFNVTALITEADSSRFLYYYTASSLRDVISTEIRARIQQDAAEFASMYDLNDLRSKKNEMLNFIKKDVIPFYKTRGITITTIGQYGGMVYENPNIQTAIDNVFIAQQEKEKAAALLSAQDDINKKSDSATNQEKKNILLLAQGKASAIEVQATAEANAIEKIANATKEASTNPTFIKIKELEVERAKIDKWNGVVPSYLIETNGKSGLNLFVPQTQ